MREKLELLVRMLLRMFQRTPLLHKKLVEFHLLIYFFHPQYRLKNLSDQDQ